MPICWIPEFRGQRALPCRSAETIPICLANPDHQNHEDIGLRPSPNRTKDRCAGHPGPASGWHLRVLACSWVRVGDWAASVRVLFARTEIHFVPKRFSPRPRSDAGRCRRYRASAWRARHGRNPRRNTPEPGRVIHLDEMGDLVGGEIVQHVGRREDQAPGIRQRSGRGARSPAARLVADRHPLDPDAEIRRVGDRALCRSLRASRLRKSWTRRSMWSAPPATHSIFSPLSRVSVQTVPRSPARCTIRCGTPRNGTTVPAETVRPSANDRDARRSSRREAARNPWLPRVPRGGMVRIASRSVG